MVTTVAAASDWACCFRAGGGYVFPALAGAFVASLSPPRGALAPGLLAVVEVALPAGPAATAAVLAVLLT